ncbi:MAG: hypothetical protein QOF70_2129 [Acetobacteraceae bacterium]|nr:hypothetical protein [Acetobacteraceae bacterium]
MIRAHLKKAAIVLTVLANEDRVHRRLHVVVDAPRAGASEEGERAVVRVEHHILGLPRIGADEHHSAVAKTGVRDCVAWMWGTKVRGRNSSNPICYLSDTDIIRASEPQHAVQGSGGEGDLSRLGLVCARAKGIADQALVAADRRLDLGPQIAAARLLPSHAAAFGDHPQVTVALCRGGVGRCACYRPGPRRDDDGGIRMTLGNCRPTHDHFGTLVEL